MVTNSLTDIIHSFTKRGFQFFLRNSILSLLCITCLLGLISPSARVYAATSISKNYIDDQADLLSDSEEGKLNELYSEYSNKHNIDIVLVTRDGLDGKKNKQYLEDYVTAVCNAGTYSENIVVMLCDMSGRTNTLQAYGTAEYIINDDNIEYILDVVNPQLTEGNYYKAFRDYAKGVNHYYNHPKFEYGPIPIYLKTWFQLVIAIVIGGITVGIMVFNSGGKTTTNNHTYLDESHSGLVAKRDIYLRTSITKVRKPTNNGGGGGRSSGGGGVSSSGRSHSGGSRGF